MRHALPGRTAPCTSCPCAWEASSVWLCPANSDSVFKTQLQCHCWCKSLPSFPNAANHLHTTFITLLLTILPSPPPNARGSMGEMVFSSAVHCQHATWHTAANQYRWMAVGLILTQVTKCSKSKDAATVSAGKSGTGVSGGYTTTGT